MKKMIAWTLVAVLTFGVFMTPAQAVEPMLQGKTITEGPRGGRPGPGFRPGPGRPGPGFRPGPPPRSYGRYSRGNNGWGWAVGGAMIGAAITSAIVNNNNNYYRSADPVLVCDAYGNCYYAYQ